MKIQANSKLVMIGDSITDCGRTRLMEEGYPDELGTGYVSLVSASIDATYPGRHIGTVNKGIGRNTSEDLASRWKTDVMDLKPDWVSILIGINDIWRKVDYPEHPERHILANHYKTTIEGMVVEAKSAGINVVLMTPFLMEKSKSDFVRQEVELFGHVCKEVAHKHQLICVDLQAAFDYFLEFNDSSVLSTDRVHPNLVGHTIIANAFLNAIEFEW